MAFAFSLPRQTWDGPQALFLPGLSSASLGGNGDGGDVVQAWKGGSRLGKISNSMAKALGPHCQGQKLLGMLAPASTSSQSQLVVGWKREYREIFLSAIFFSAFSSNISAAN